MRIAGLAAANFSKLVVIADFCANQDYIAKIFASIVKMPQ